MSPIFLTLAIVQRLLVKLKFLSLIYYCKLWPSAMHLTHVSNLYTSSSEQTVNDYNDIEYFGLQLRMHDKQVYILYLNVGIGYNGVTKHNLPICYIILFICTIGCY